jgi:hypothetical protein
VNAAEKTEIFATKRLNPEAQSADAEGAEGSQRLLVDRAGVCLQRDLGVCRDPKSVPQAGENPFKLSGGKQRWGAAAEEDGLEGSRTVLVTPERDLLRQRRQEILDQFGAVNRIEVAVKALALTEGDVDVKGWQRAPPTS